MVFVLHAAKHIVTYMQALLVLLHCGCMHGTFKLLSEYNEDIAGTYGAGSRGICRIQAPSNTCNGQYNSNTCVQLYIYTLLHVL